MPMLKTFAIETSCDDTCVAIVEYYDWVIKTNNSFSYSQIADHQKYWWVVPEVASRIHNEKILQLIQKVGIDNIKWCDFISYTSTPGLPWSLLVWATTANMLSNFLSKQLVSVNHIYWHIFSLFLDRKIESIKFPMVVLTASGWHNDIYFVDKTDWKNTDLWKYKIKKIWQTIDDASWEAFDKVSKMLGWPYPWGGWIYEKAKKWVSKYDITPTFLKKDEFNFSFSWTKSKVYYIIKNLQKEKQNLSEQDVYDIAYAFQEWVVEVLSKKLLSAANKYSAKTVGLAWGVSANSRLLDYFQDLKKQKWNKKLELLVPAEKYYCTDNACMIWAAGILSKLF